MPDIREILESKKRLLCEAEEQLAQITSEIATMKEENESVKSEIENLNRKIGMKKNELERRSKQLDAMKSKLTQAETERDKMNESSDQNHSEEQELESLESEFSELQVENRTKECRLNELEIRHQKMKNDIAMQNRLLGNLKAKYETTQKELDALRNQTGDVAGGSSFNEDEAMDIRRDLESQIRELDVSNDDIIRKITMKTNQKNTLNTALASLEKQISQLESDMKSMTDELMA